jgi:excisionase family DNA binding protein
LNPSFKGFLQARKNAMNIQKEVMNVREASQYLGISPDTLYKYVSSARIPAFKLGNRWRFKKTILDTWMERKSSVPIRMRHR